MSVKGTINDVKSLCKRGSLENARSLLQGITGATKAESYEIFALVGWINWKKGGRFDKSMAVTFWNDVIKNGKRKSVAKIARASAYFGLSIYFKESENYEKALEHMNRAKTLYPDISEERVFEEIEEKED